MVIEKPLISIIVPAYNEEKNIERCLDSVNRQDYPYKELVIVPNGCKDGTAEIAEGFTENIFDLRERNYPKAKNIGIEKANGEIITFLDSDSEMGEKLLYHAWQAMMGNYVGGKAKIVPYIDDIRAKILFGFVNSCSWASMLLGSHLRKLHGGRILQSGAGVFMFSDRETIEKIRKKYGTVFDEDIGTMSGVDISKKLCREGPVKFITESFVRTSTRRYEGRYFREFVNDVHNYANPKRKRYTYR